MNRRSLITKVYNSVVGCT